MQCSKSLNQVMKLELKYGAEVNIMSYDMNWEGAYREKNKIPRLWE